MSGEILVEVGCIPLETLEAWANRSKRFVKLMSDEKIFEEACTSAREQVKEQLRGSEINEEEIDEFANEFFELNLKKNVMVIYGRAAVKAFFDNKKLEEIEAETIDNPEWVQSAVEQSKDWCVYAAVRAFRYMIVQVPSIVVEIYHPNLNDKHVSQNEGKTEEVQQ